MPSTIRAVSGRCARPSPANPPLPSSLPCGPRRALNALIRRCAGDVHKPQIYTSIWTSGLGAIRGMGRKFNQLRLAGELGFEPRQTESESVVLPLHHSPQVADITAPFPKVLQMASENRCRSYK